MLSRAVWTVVLALIAWIPSGRGDAWASRGNRVDRAILSISALEVAAESPARIASTTDGRLDPAAAKRPEPSRTLTPSADAPDICSWSVAANARTNVRREHFPWRAFRCKRLSFPHDATAPPSYSSQS